MHARELPNLIIAVPLAHEYRALQRHLRKSAVLASTRILCCGPCERGMRRLGEHQAVANQPTTVSTATEPLVILAGLAGALTRRCAVGSAHWIRRVMDESGASHTPSFIPPEYQATHHLLPTVTTATESCTAPKAKRMLAERTGADLVDLESLHFARLAEERGWRWGIVRGVSDGPADVLPDGVDAWLEDSGHIRLGTVIRAIAYQPRLIGDLLYLRRTSMDALRSVGERLTALWL